MSQELEPIALVKHRDLHLQWDEQRGFAYLYNAYTPFARVRPCERVINGVTIQGMTTTLPSGDELVELTFIRTRDLESGRRGMALEVVFKPLPALPGWRPA